MCNILLIYQTTEAWNGLCQEDKDAFITALATSSRSCRRPASGSAARRKG